MQEEETEEYDKAAEVQAEVKVEAEVERRQKARRRGAHGAERECGGDRVWTAEEIHRLQKYRAGSEKATQQKLQRTRHKMSPTPTVQKTTHMLMK
jgi:hypothetical protein